MNNISPLLLLSLGELLVVTSILSVVMILLAVIKKKRDRVSAQKLIERIKQDEQRRQQETRDLMGRNFGLQGELLDALVRKIGREEKFFYQTLINLYLKRDSSALEVLHVAFEGTTEPYRTLQLPKTETQTKQDAGGGESDAFDKILGLQEENKRLSDELRITMDTMGRMLSEYSSMYSGSAATELDKEKILSMFRAEAEEKLSEEARQEMQTAAADPAVDTASGQEAVDDDIQSVLPELPGNGEAEVHESIPSAPREQADDDLDDDLLSLDDNQTEPLADAKRVS